MKKFNNNNMKFLKLVDGVCNILYHTPKNGKPIILKMVKSIIIIDFTLIGDMVMLLPFIKILRQNCPLATISLVCSNWGKIVLENSHLVDEFFIFQGYSLIDTPKHIIKSYLTMQHILKQINRKNYEIAIEPRGDIRFIWFMHHIKSQRKISYNYSGGISMLTDVVQPNPSITHLIEDKIYLLDILGCKYSINDKIPTLTIDKMDAILQQDYLKNHKISSEQYITGIHPGASLKIKQWDGFGKLAEILFEENQKQLFLIFEGPDEHQSVMDVVTVTKKIGANFLVVKENLRLYMLLLARCDRVICNDSGAGHIASAYSVPVTSVFGPTDPALGRPYSKAKVIVASSEAICKPCNGRDCFLEEKQCWREITPEFVKKLMEGNQNG